MVGEGLADIPIDMNKNYERFDFCGEISKKNPPKPIVRAPLNPRKKGGLGVEVRG